MNVPLSCRTGMNVSQGRPCRRQTTTRLTPWTTSQLKQILSISCTSGESGAAPEDRYTMFPPSSARIYEEADKQSLPSLPGCATQHMMPGVQEADDGPEQFTFRKTNTSYTECLTSPLVRQFASLVSTARVRSAPLSPPARIWVTTAACILQSNEIRSKPSFGEGFRCPR
jgi:hypothetical protein